MKARLLHGCVIAILCLAAVPASARQRLDKACSMTSYLPRPGLAQFSSPNKMSVEMRFDEEKVRELPLMVMEDLLDYQDDAKQYLDCIKEWRAERHEELKSLRDFIKSADSAAKRIDHERDNDGLLSGLASINPLEHPSFAYRCHLSAGLLGNPPSAAQVQTWGSCTSAWLKRLDSEWRSQADDVQNQVTRAYARLREVRTSAYDTGVAAGGDQVAQAPAQRPQAAPPAQPSQPPRPPTPARQTPPPSGPQRYLVLLGGSGLSDYDAEDEPFDRAPKALAAHAGDDLWNKTLVAWAPWSSTRDAAPWVEQLQPLNTMPFNQNNFGAIVTALVEPGRMQRGDRVVLVLDGYGRAQQRKEQTHALQGGVYRSKDPHMVPLDDLQKLAQASQRLGFALAIVDLSAHAGSTLGVANESTCVIAATDADGARPDLFGAALIGAWKKGSTLEQGFLAARRANAEGMVPLISTPQGESVMDNLYETLRPHLLVPDAADGALRAYLDGIAGSEAQAKARNDRFQALTRKLHQIEADSKRTGRPVAVQRLLQLLTRSKEAQDRYIALARSLGGAQLTEPHAFQARGTDEDKSASVSGSFTLEQLLAPGFDSNLQEARRLLDRSEEPEEVAQGKAIVSLMQQAIAFRNERLAQQPGLREAGDRLKAALRQIPPELAGQIATGRLSGSRVTVRV